MSLFIDRAAAVKPDFMIADLDVPYLCAICERLDGIPLAIELTAVQARFLTIEEIASLVDNLIYHLRMHNSMPPSKQQILWAVIDCSYDLLDKKQKELHARLSVFIGGCRMESAETVCSGGGVQVGEILKILTSLVENCLVICDDGRYHLVDSIQEYACEILEKSGESESVEERHRDYFLALAEESDQKLKSSQQDEWLSLLEREHENLRTALSFSIKRNEAAIALKFCGALQQFWFARGHFDEGRQWCESALKLTNPSERSIERARALHVAGVLSKIQGDFVAAQAYHEESLGIRREIGDGLTIAASLNGLGNVACELGKYADARRCYEESLSLKRRIGNRKAEAGSFNNLGFVDYLQGNYPSARLYYEQSLEIWREFGDVKLITASLLGFAELSVAEGEWDRGARLWSVIEMQWEQSESIISSNDREARDRDITTLRQELGQERIAEVWAAGREMTLEQTIDYALS